MLAPAGTPPAVIRKLHLETLKALSSPDLRVKFRDLALEPVGNAPDELAAIVKSEIPRWTKVIQDSAIKPE